jgi:hypothetical protein
MGRLDHRRDRAADDRSAHLEPLIVCREADGTVAELDDGTKNYDSIILMRPGCFLMGVT